MIKKTILFVLVICTSLTYSQVVIDSYRFESVSAIYDGPNAADPVNEVNGTANFSVVSNHTLSVESTTVQHGSYAVKITRTVAGGAAYVVDATMIGVLDTQNVTITLQADENVGTAWQMRTTTAKGWSGQTPVTFSGTGYDEYQITQTATQNDPVIEFRSLSGASDNDVLLIDNIVITIN